MENKIGILGFGKMGSEVFHAFFDKKEISSQIIVYVRHNIEEYTAKINKELDKSLKRGKFSQEIYDIKKSSFCFTDDISMLSDCNLVIESVVEDINIKNELLRKVDGVVGNDCIISTNSSSLNIRNIFNGISNPERCLGLHFFYPVKLTNYIEINKRDENSKEIIDRAANIAEMIQKKYVILSGDYHMYMNQFISVAIANGLLIAKKYRLSIEDCQNVYEEMFPMHGLFGMIDSIGEELLQKSAANFKLQRVQPLACKSMELYKEIKSFDTYNEITPEIKECIKSELINALTEEIKLALAENENKETLYEAAMDAIGIDGGYINV